MIIVEGFDGAGKTTIANAIGKALGWEVLHTGGPTKNISHVEQCLDRSKRRFEYRCVQDRTTHVSEIAYSMLTHPQKAAAALARLDEVRFAWAYIYCRPSTGALLRALEEDHVLKPHDTSEHMRKVKKQAEAIIGVYDTLSSYIENIPSVRTIKYDRFRTGDFERVIEQITKHMRGAMR